MSETAFTPGPWSFCCEKCETVMSKDHPICDVTHGDWGDSYPAIRLSGDGLHGQEAEAYVNLIAYGHVEKEMATANARLIAAAPELYEALKAWEAYVDKWFDASNDLQGEAYRLTKAALAKARGETP